MGVTDCGAAIPSFHTLNYLVNSISLVASTAIPEEKSENSVRVLHLIQCGVAQSLMDFSNCSGSTFTGSQICHRSHSEKLHMR